MMAKYLVKISPIRKKGELTAVGSIIELAPAETIGLEAFLEPLKKKNEDQGGSQ